MILFRINLSRDDSNEKAMQVFMLTSLWPMRWSYDLFN